MSAPVACAEPGIICAIVGFAERLFANPWLAVAAVVVLALSLIGLHTSRAYLAEHGLKKTAVRGLGLLRDTGYTLFSTAKFAGGGTGPGMVAACLALLVGISHMPSSGHGSHKSDAAATASSHPPQPRAFVPVAEPRHEPVAAVKESPPVEHERADALKDAARFAAEFRHRKVEVRYGQYTMIVHPEDKPDDATPA